MFTVVSSQHHYQTILPATSPGLMLSLVNARLVVENAEDDGA